MDWFRMRVTPAVKDMCNMLLHEGAVFLLVEELHQDEMDTLMERKRFMVSKKCGSGRVQREIQFWIERGCPSTTISMFGIGANQYAHIPKDLEGYFR